MLLLSSAFIFISSSSHHIFFLPDIVHFGVWGLIPISWNISAGQFSSFEFEMAYNHLDQNFERNNFAGDLSNVIKSVHQVVLVIILYNVY